MANDRYNQFLFSKEPMLTMISGSFVVGATGAVSTISGKNVKSVTRLAQGIYQIKLTQNYPALVSFDSHVDAGVTGSVVNAGSFITGTLYQITALGTTTQAQWVAAGLDADYTAAVGMPFVAIAGGAGNGTATAIGSTGIQQVELARVASSMLTNLNPGQAKGASVIIRTVGATNSSTTTPIPVDPASGSIVAVKLWFRNSSVANY